MNYKKLLKPMLHKYYKFEDNYIYITGIGDSGFLFGVKFYNADNLTIDLKNISIDICYRIHSSFVVDKEISKEHFKAAMKQFKKDLTKHFTIKRIKNKVIK